jgi:hypothetical protein
VMAQPIMIPRIKRMALPLPAGLTAETGMR